MSKTMTRRLETSTKKPCTTTEVERVTHSMRPCPGEAHSNPHIDHCGICLGHTWGSVPAYVPVDLLAAQQAKQDVPFSFLTDAQLELADEMVRRGVARQVDVTAVAKGARTSYLVLRWS